MLIFNKLKSNARDTTYFTTKPLQTDMTSGRPPKRRSLMETNQI